MSLSSKLLKLNLPKTVFNDTIDNFMLWQMYNIHTYLCELAVSCGLDNSYTPLYNLLFSCIRYDKLSILNLCSQGADKHKLVWSKYFPNSTFHTQITSGGDTFNIIMVDNNLLTTLSLTNIISKLDTGGICIIRHAIPNDNSPHIMSLFTSTQYKLVRLVTIPNRHPSVLLIVNI